MARNHRICKACGKPIARNHHWHLVETTLFERLMGRLGGRIRNHHEPEHHNCAHPQKLNPATFVGVEHNLPEHIEKEFENL